MARTPMALVARPSSTTSSPRSGHEAKLVSQWRSRGCSACFGKAGRTSLKRRGPGALHAVGPLWPQSANAAWRCPDFHEPSSWRKFSDPEEVEQIDSMIQGVSYQELMRKEAEEKVAAEKAAAKNEPAPERDPRTP